MIKRQILLTGTVGLLSMVVGLTTTHARKVEARELTAEAMAAVRNVFPSATILGVGLEREDDVQYYEVVVRDGDETLEIEVTPAGAIGEIETEVALADVPKVALDGIVKSTGGATVRKVERHEVRGVPKDGEFVSVDPPLVFFEAKYQAAGIWKEIAVTTDGKSLPSDHDDGDSDSTSDDDSDSDSEAND